MKSRLAKSVMVLAAIAMAISLAVALAPDASAQNSGTAVKDVETNTHAVPVYTSKVCCITVSPLYQGTTISSESSGCETPFCCPSRWFCMDNPL